MTERVACFHARVEIERCFLPLTANILFVSIKNNFGWKKFFCEIFLPLWIHRSVNINKRKESRFRGIMCIFVGFE